MDQLFQIKVLVGIQIPLFNFMIYQYRL